MCDPNGAEWRKKDENGNCHDYEDANQDRLPVDQIHDKDPKLPDRSLK